jgi:pilus assembly protein CpaE
MRAVIADESSKLGDRLRQVVLGVGLECGAADRVSYANLQGRLTQAPADLVLVVLGADRSDGLALIQELARTSLPVLAVGPSSDSQQILQALRAGARGYMDEAHLREELLGALEKLHAAGSVPFRRGQTIAVLAATPGTGVTTVASSLAFALAERAPQRVALAEVGSGVPDLSLNLNLDPRHTVADLADQWERLDATMLRQALVEHPAGVNVLAYKPETLNTAPIQPTAMRQTVILLSALFDFTVLDLGHSTDVSRLEALALASSVVLVVRLDVPSLRLTRQLIRQLGLQGLPQDKLRVVANRYGQRKQVAWKKAAEVLGLPIQGWVPEDPATLNQAHNHGLPLVRVARRASITRTFDKLAQTFRTAAA